MKIMFGNYICLLPIFLAMSCAKYSGYTGPIKYDLTGNWEITWLDNNSKNRIMLNQNDDIFTGIYKNDQNDTCDVKGKYTSSEGEIKLNIACNDWDILLSAYHPEGPETINGTFWAYKKKNGRFEMIKE